MDKSTEIAYKRGLLPLCYYNQLNGKSLQENYNAVKEEQQRMYNEQIDKAALENELSQIIEDKLVEIFKTLNFSF